MITNSSGQLSLSAAQLEEYEENGCVVLPAYLDGEMLERLSRAADDLVVRLGPIEPGARRVQVDTTADGYRIRLAEPVLDLSSTFVNLAEDDRITGLFQSLFGEAPVLFEDKVNYKYPRGGSLFPPHQDFSYWQPYSPRLASALIYIDEATEENGCLEVALGWHKKGLLPKTGLRINQGMDHHVPGDVLDPSLLVKVTGPPGTLILFSCLTPHSSAPNLSNAPRRAIILTYGPASAGDSYQERYGHPRPTHRGAAQV
jgi:ectoine hydroxylase-related dioxygenase (phytanoyl-CoA dioxygenase family)